MQEAKGAELREAANCGEFMFEVFAIDDERANSESKLTTTKELMDQLEGNPEYVARLAARQAAREQRTKELQAAMAGVVDELRQAGFGVESVDQLRREVRTYRGAMEILVRWLPLVRELEAKESIVRALSVPWGGQRTAEALVTEFLAAPTEGPHAASLKWAIGNGLEITAEMSMVQSLCDLAVDPAHGQSREMIVVALGKMPCAQAEATLVQLLHDAELDGFAATSLARLNVDRYRTLLERFTKHPLAWVRKEMTKLLRPRSQEQQGR